MSFGIFLQCYRDGKSVEFSRSFFEEIFGSNAVRPNFPLSTVDYPDGSGGEIYGGEDDPITCLMFNHCGGEMFFAAVHELAHRTGSVIFWADRPPCIAVTETETIAHLPGGFEDMGPAQIVKNARELIEYIGRPR